MALCSVHKTTFFFVSTHFFLNTFLCIRNNPNLTITIRTLTYVHTNPHWARVVGYGPLSLCVIHKEALCLSSGDINRLMMISNVENTQTKLTDMLMHTKVCTVRESNPRSLPQ
jgi:hypothetical protein